MYFVRAFCLIAVLAAVPFAASTARAQEKVPETLAQITDPEMRDALSMYSPGYDYLARGSQVFAFRHVFMNLHGGALPHLEEADAQHVPGPELLALDSIPEDPSPNSIAPDYTVTPDEAEQDDVRSLDLPDDINRGFMDMEDDATDSIIDAYGQSGGSHIDNPPVMA